MGGGKSSSSSSTQNETNTSSQTTTGNLGTVLQGADISVVQDFAPEVAAAFQSLIDLNMATQEGAVKFASENLKATQSLASSTQQPDLTLVQGYQKQVYYAIGAAALVGVIVLFARKKG